MQLKNSEGIKKLKRREMQVLVFKKSERKRKKKFKLFMWVKV